LDQRLDFAAACRLLDAGATLVTANNRLARHLAVRLAQIRSAFGDSVWETPDILPLGTWLRRAYEGLTENDPDLPRLLTPHAQRLLWERQVRQSQAADRLLRPDAAAALAAEAWTRLCAWNLPLEAVDPGAGEEARAFLGWARGYLRACDAGRWLDPAFLPATLTEAIVAGTLPARPPALVFAGFEELTPATRKLAEALAAAGCTVRELAPDAMAGKRGRIALQDRRGELRAAAAWAADRLNRDPAARLGIAIPDLALRRSQVVQALDALLHPEAATSPREPAGRVYNLTLGQPLSDHPLVNDALSALRLLIAGLDLTDLSTLLRSPFLGEGDSEYLPRCRLEALLRTWPEQRIQAHRLCSLAEHGCPALARILRAATAALEGGPASPAHWAGRFRAALSALGWPGQRAVDSSEHQQTQRLRDLVDDLPTLAGVEPRMDARRALACLADMARHTTFQAESQGRAPIEVMGLLEADGQTFDGLWIVGLSDQQYPPAAEPHPLLPVALQRSHDMPHASAERELDFARRLLARLLGAAPEVILSWPQREEDRELLPTPLILHLPEAAFAGETLADLEKVDERWLGKGGLDSTADHLGVPLRAETAMRGGTRLLLDQAACPFRAYAHHRLHAAGLGDPEPGPSVLVRGNLLHAALEAFWNDVGSHARLLGLGQEALREHIGAAAEQALSTTGRDLRGESRRLEQRRLQRRLAAWLTIERERLPFTVVATEERREVVIGKLRLDTLADRVDRLADGRLVVIDYKSGNARRDGWFGDRLFEPQLPLYATTLAESPVAAVSFAKLRPDDTRFIGTAADDGLLPAVTALTRDRQRGELADWTALLGHWREQLETLAAEVRAGLAPVDPKKKDACARCDLGDLCRIAEASDHLSEESIDD